MAGHVVDESSFANVERALADYEEQLLCQYCRMLPTWDTAKIMVVSSCGHQLCNKCCAPSTWNNFCPVAGCGLKASHKDLVDDVDGRQRVESFVKLKALWKPDVVVQPSNAGDNPKGRSKKVDGDREKFKRPSADCLNRPKTAGIPQGKELNKKNAKGETPLHVSCCKGNVERVRKLLDVGANTNTQDNNGWTPLHEVAQGGHVEIVRLLLDHGADPNVPGGDNNATPLHDAAQSGFVDICRLLIQRGADKEARNGQGSIPMDLAVVPDVRRAIEETSSEMSETEMLETTLLVNNSASVSDRVFLFCAGLAMDQIEAVKDGASELGATVSKTLTEEVTHVIVNVDQSTKSCPESFAYYSSLLMGKWIVSYRWFKMSLTNGKWEPEEPYLPTGTKGYPRNAPELSRTNFSSRKPRLFDGFHIYLHGNFARPYPSKPELIAMLKSGGAVVLRREPDPEAIPADEQRLPYHVASGSALEKCSHFIIYQEGQKEPLLKYNMGHVKSLPTAWLFECINNFRIVEPFN